MCRKRVVRSLHATKSYCVNQPLGSKLTVYCSVSHHFMLSVYTVLHVDSTASISNLQFFCFSPPSDSLGLVQHMPFCSFLLFVFHHVFFLYLRLDFHLLHHNIYSVLCIKFCIMCHVNSNQLVYQANNFHNIGEE